MTRISTTTLDQFLGFHQHNKTTFPPYDIIEVGCSSSDDEQSDDYAIVIAVAGYTDDDINISELNGLLTVTGEKRSSNYHPDQYLRQGIAQRDFELTWSLHEHVEVGAARLEDGLLTIELTKRTPAEKLPRNIKINK